MSMVMISYEMKIRFCKESWMWVAAKMDERAGPAAMYLTESPASGECRMWWIRVPMHA